MKLTIKCDCGAEYNVDFEPVDGKLPGDFICPQCNTDKTDLVNRLIAAQSGIAAAPTPAAAPPPPTPQPEPSAAPRQPLRFKKPGSYLADPTAASPAAPVPPPPPASKPPPVPTPQPPAPAAEANGGAGIKLRRPPSTPSATPTPPGMEVPSATKPSAPADSAIRLRRPEDANPQSPSSAAAKAATLPTSIPGLSLTQPPPSAPVAEPEPEPAVAQTCSKHTNQPVTMFCFVCKRPMCALCMKKTGFVCSSYCQGKAKEQNIAIPYFEGQESGAPRQAASGGGHRIGLGLFLILLGLLGAFVWYKFVGSRPTVVYTIPVTKPGSTEWAQFIDNNRFLWMRGEEIVLVDTATQSDVWSYRIKVNSSSKPSDGAYWMSRSRALESIADPKQRQEAESLLVQERISAWRDSFEDQTRVVQLGSELWIATGSNLVCLDRNTGTEKGTYTIRGQIEKLSVADQNALVMSTENNQTRYMTRINLVDGKTLVLPAPPLPKVATVGTPPAAASLPPNVDESGMDMDGPNRRSYHATGENFAQLDVALLKENIVMEDAVRPNPDVNLNAVTAGNQGAAINQVLTDLRTSHTGGKRRVDRSEYQVTIRRHLVDKPIPAWSGTVIGKPYLFSTATLDVLIADTNVRVFDKQNKLLWQGTLVYPIDHKVSVDRSNPESGPCFERGNTLYIADRGAMRAFSVIDGKTGTWTYPTVGISQIQFDGEGMMYLTGTNADPDSIQYDQEVRWGERIHPVLIKLDPRNQGKEVWKFAKGAQDNFSPRVTGKYVYVTTSSISSADMVAAFTSGSGDVPIHFRIFRLNSETGEVMWEYYKSKSSSFQALDFSANKILVAWPEEIDILKYYDLF